MMQREVEDYYLDLSDRAAHHKTIIDQAIFCEAVNAYNVIYLTALMAAFKNQWMLAPLVQLIAAYSPQGFSDAAQLLEFKPLAEEFHSLKIFGKDSSTQALSIATTLKSKISENLLAQRKTFTPLDKKELTRNYPNHPENFCTLLK